MCLPNRIPLDDGAVKSDAGSSTARLTRRSPRCAAYAIKTAPPPEWPNAWNLSNPASSAARSSASSSAEIE
jgi:hypothetical protein